MSLKRKQTRQRHDLHRADWSTQRSSQSFYGNSLWRWLAHDWSLSAQRSIHRLEFLRFIGLLLAVWICAAGVAGAFVLQPHAQSRSPLMARVPTILKTLPNLQAHPIPFPLSQWQDRTNSGDYFSDVQPTEVGYLVWSQFPVKVYIEPGARSPSLFTYTSQREQAWVDAVEAAVREWSVYFPLETTLNADIADITVLRSPPPLVSSQQNSSEPKPWDRNYRIRSAETRYDLYISRAESQPGRLIHRCTILLRPNQTPQYLQAAARHELGHALGIWGHSPLQTDALYFSQVRQPPAISLRDVNTLKRVYEQPTRLGWPLPTA